MADHKVSNEQYEVAFTRIALRILQPLRLAADRNGRITDTLLAETAEAVTRGMSEVFFETAPELRKIIKKLEDA